MSKTIAVIDGNSLMHRAFHGIRQPMMAPDGRATNAIYGFFTMFLKMIETFHPDGVICAFDKGKPQIRMDMYSEYKAQRPPMDPSLREQFPLVKELLGALDIPVCELEGWEGDDVLGTLAKKGESAGYTMLLITGDRDMYQLATENVKIVSTKKGMSDIQIMTPESVDDLYHGITPELVPDFYGLKGDTSDNIPGVPGIGPKKAAALIVEYGNLDEVIAHAGEVKGKMGENLRANIDNALLSRKLATIRCDAPLDIDLADASFPTFDMGRVRAAFSALGFGAITKRLVSLAGPIPEGSDAVSSAIVMPEVLDGEAAIKKLDEAIAQKLWIGVEVQDDSQGKAQLSLGFDSELTLWFAGQDFLVKLTGQEALEYLVKLVRTGNLVASDVKKILRNLVPLDSSEERLVDETELASERLFDAGIAGYLLDSDAGTYDVETLLGESLPEPTDELPHAAAVAYTALCLAPKLAHKLEEDGSAAIFTKIEMPLLLTLLEMERRGLLADRAAFATQSNDVTDEIEAIVAKIREAAGPDNQDFNIDSPAQLSHVLFDVWELPTAGLKKTKSGFYSTNAKVLADLADKDERVRQVLDYRERAKIKSTYLDALPQLIRADGRIHTTFNQTVAATGRLSSSDPNLQNIPTRSELGHRVRSAFTVADGSVFLACDYSQIELRLLAHLSGDEHLISAFNHGEDFHAETAARVFGIDVSEVTPALRSRAKAVNFGIVYGQQAFGLATTLKISRSEAQDMIDRYFEAYPGVRNYLDSRVEEARKTGVALTMYGRKRHIKDINSKNFTLRSFAERTAMNHPMQGSAADIIKLAMIEVEKKLREQNLQSKLILQIHDELDLEVPTSELELVKALVQETMEGVCELKVPLIAEVSVGNTWAEAK